MADEDVVPHGQLNDGEEVVYFVVGVLRSVLEIQSYKFVLLFFRIPLRVHLQVLAHRLLLVCVDNIDLLAAMDGEGPDLSKGLHG